jgi:hypothetical protein
MGYSGSTAGRVAKKAAGLGIAPATVTEFLNSNEPVFHVALSTYPRQVK